MSEFKDISLDEFLKVAQSEGITNRQRVIQLWELRPLLAEYNEDKLRQTFRHFREEFNR